GRPGSRPRGAAVEQPRIAGHHRSRLDPARIVEVHALPVVTAPTRLPRQVGADAARPPQVREVLARLPVLGGRAEAAHVGLDGAYLFRVAVGGPFARVHFTARLP